MEQATRLLPHAALIYFARRWSRGARSGWLAAGLAACAAGDFVLRLPGGFLPGLGAFFLGHVLLIVAMSLGRPPLRLWLAVPLLAYGVAFYSVLLPGLGPLAVPVAAYALALSAMGWRVACRPERAALPGALVFMVSDSLLGWSPFRAPIPGGRYLIILTYWSALSGLAWTARARR